MDFNSISSNSYSRVIRSNIFYRTARMLIGLYPAMATELYRTDFVIKPSNFVKQNRTITRSITKLNGALSIFTGIISCSSIQLYDNFWFNEVQQMFNKFDWLENDETNTFNFDQTHQTSIELIELYENFLVQF